MSRAVFILVTLFWLTMDGLLWRAEFGASQSGGPMPADLVWRRILSAPDGSSLSIFFRGEKVGFCHWVTGVGDEWAGVNEQDVGPKFPKKLTGYSLRVEGMAILPQLTNRVRFDGSLSLDREEQWQDITAHVNIRPIVLEIHSVAAEQTMRFSADDGTEEFERVFHFSDLQNPGVLLGEFFGPFAEELADEIAPGGLKRNLSLASAVKWEARTDSLQIGHTPVEVFRVQTRFLDKYSVVIFASPVGEILRIEMPGGLTLVNDQLRPLD